jgi:hypothetical protein
MVFSDCKFSLMSRNNQSTLMARFRGKFTSNSRSIPLKLAMETGTSDNTMHTSHRVPSLDVVCRAYIQRLRGIIIIRRSAPDQSGVTLIAASRVAWWCGEGDAETEESSIVTQSRLHALDLFLIQSLLGPLLSSPILKNLSIADVCQLNQ